MAIMKWECARVSTDGEITRGGIYTTDINLASQWARENNESIGDENSFYVVVEADENAISEWENERECEEAAKLKYYHFEWRETFRDYFTIEAHDEEEAWEKIEECLAWENRRIDLSSDSMSDGEWCLVDIDE